MILTDVLPVEFVLKSVPGMRLVYSKAVMQ